MRRATHCVVALIMLLSPLVARDVSERRWIAYPSVRGGLVLRVAASNGETRSNRVSIADLRSLVPLNLIGSRATFQLRGDGGEIRCQGGFLLGVGSGSLKIVADRAVLANLSSYGYRDPSGDEVVELILRKVTFEFVREVERVCSTCSSVSDVLRLVNSGLDRTYLRELQETTTGTYSIGELLELRSHGVAARFVKGMKDSVYDASVQSIVELYDSGVPVVFARQIHECGYQVSARELIALHAHGVGAELICTASSLHRPRRVDDLVRLQSAGIPSMFLREVAALMPDTQVDDVIRLHNGGVSTQFIRDLSSCLGRSVSPGEALGLHDRGGLSDSASAGSCRLSWEP
jgi:hypothetical protein